MASVSESPSFFLAGRLYRAVSSKGLMMVHDQAAQDIEALRFLDAREAPGNAWK